jgi:hypothetical protein
LHRCKVVWWRDLLQNQRRGKRNALEMTHTLQAPQECVCPERQINCCQRKPPEQNYMLPGAFTSAPELLFLTCCLLAACAEVTGGAKLTKQI